LRIELRDNALATIVVIILGDEHRSIIVVVIAVVVVVIAAMTIVVDGRDGRGGRLKDTTFVVHAIVVIAVMSDGTAR